jgi:hypothetical protein
MRISLLWRERGGLMETRGVNRCLYTYVELNGDVPANDRTASFEHIVPYALGGSDAFGISYCSKRANNDFGRDIDAPFIALPLVGFVRHQLGLKGNSGKVPDLVFKGACPELGRECDIVFPYEGEPYPDFGIDVAGSMGAGKVSFSGSETRLRQAVTGMLKKAKSGNYTVLSDNHHPVTSFEDAMITAQRETGETLSFRLDFGDSAFVRPWTLGLIKIALGLGARALGPTWAFSADADRLRACLADTSPKGARPSVRGNTLMKLTPELQTLTGVRPGRHTLAVLPHPEGMMACISLFGGNVFDAIIDLGNGPADIKVANETLPADWTCIFHIDPTTRRLETATCADVQRAVDLLSK